MPKKKNLEGLVEEGWLHVTDDTVLDEGCADLVEVFWKMGFLEGMTVAAGLRNHPDYALVEEAADSHSRWITSASTCATSPFASSETVLSSLTLGLTRQKK
jgi:hypothetical protein